MASANHVPIGPQLHSHWELVAEVPWIMEHCIFPGRGRSQEPQARPSVTLVHQKIPPGKALQRTWWAVGHPDTQWEGKGRPQDGHSQAIKGPSGCNTCTGSNMHGKHPEGAALDRVGRVSMVPTHAVMP